MLETILQPTIAYAQKDFFEALRSRRLLTVSIILGAILIGGSAALSFAMVRTPAPDSGQPGVPDPYEVWYRGPNGVLTGVAFGLTAVLYPFVPILVVGRFLIRDQNRGLSELSLTKPVPSWGLALGKFAGLYGALAIHTIVMSVGVVLAIQIAAGTSVDEALFLSYTVGNIVLVGLYLLLILFVWAILHPDLAGLLVLLSWLIFNVVRLDGFSIAARLGTLIGFDEAATFQVAWTDLVSFTGIYQTIVASSVPSDLGFVIAPGPAGALDVAAKVVPWAALFWSVLVVAGYALNLRRRLFD